MTGDDRDDTSRNGGDERGATRELDEVKADLGALVASHPVGALAVALGAGYALGGGVFTRLTSGILRLGLRLGIQLAVMPLVEQELASLVGFGPQADGADGDALPGERH
ncbi:MAG TPA: hypothetical protein VHL80_06605 [Polyangia bacterium]|nr:hypothetical protein [Polyangia bacterium]